MKYFYIVLAVLGLSMVLIPSLLCDFDAIDLEQMKNYMFIGTLLWFSGAIPWLGRKKAQN